MDLNIVLSMLMKLPERRMASIKRDFGRMGLSLESFVSVMVHHLNTQPKSPNHRKRRNQEELEKIELVSDLNDFFDQVRYHGHRNGSLIGVT